MKNLFVLAFILCTNVIYSQYYYSDLIGTGQTNQQYKLIRSAGLKKIIATGFEANNEPSKDFVLEQQVNNNAQQIVTRSATIGSLESYFTSSYQNGKISRTYDSNSNAINVVEYKYDASGKLLSTYSTSKDFDGTFMSTEAHLWRYNELQNPSQMFKIKNGTDTTFISFKFDDNGNVAEETWQRKNREIERYYYYYNNKNLLTDIARYNRKAQQLLPDYMFEYDSNGRITQMTQTQAATANYLIYRYAYNDRGLKEKEQVYNKKKEYLGKVEYSYQ